MTTGPSPGEKAELQAELASVRHYTHRCTCRLFMPDDEDPDRCVYCDGRPWEETDG